MLWVSRTATRCLSDARDPRAARSLERYASDLSCDRRAIDFAQGRLAGRRIEHSATLLRNNIRLGTGGEKDTCHLE